MTKVKQINEEQTIGTQINDINMKNKRLIILVNEIESTQEELIIGKIKKDIICPYYQESCLIKRYDFKLYLFGCSINHNNKGLNIMDLTKTQLNISKIIC